MSSGRTEEPTPRRLREARRRGEVARSAGLPGAAALAGGLCALGAAGPSIVRTLAAGIRDAVACAGDPRDPSAVVSGALAAVLRSTLPVAGAALALATLAGALQTGFLFSPEALRPRLERLDPWRGLRRLCSAAQLRRAGFGVLQAAVLAALLPAWWRDAAPALAALPGTGRLALAGVVPLLRPLASRLAFALAAAGTVELALARLRHRRALRMTRDEVRRELREEEGDAAHRAERRWLHRALLEAGGVARATVVLVNPARIAVALRHERGGDGAPRVVAKGAGAAAARIRSTALRAGIPIVRDVPLARALHRLAEVGDEIPEELYDAAAAVLAHLYSARERA